MDHRRALSRGATTSRWRRGLRNVVLAVLIGSSAFPVLLVFWVGGGELFLGALVLLALAGLLIRRFFGGEQRLRLTQHRRRDRQRLEQALEEGGPVAAPSAPHRHARHGVGDAEKAAFGRKPPTTFRGLFPKGRI